MVMLLTYLLLKCTYRIVLTVFIRILPAANINFSLAGVRLLRAAFINFEVIPLGDTLFFRTGFRIFEIYNR